MNNKKLNILLFILCYLLVISPIIYTEIFPWILTPHGFDYSPVNTFAFRRNDTYFYASFFREICQSGFIFNSPSTETNLAGVSQYSFFFTSNFFISIGCLFDFRTSFIITYISALLIIFIFLNKIFFVFTKNKNFSYILSIFFILYSKPMFQDIPFIITNLDLLFYFKKILINYLNPLELDSSSQIFRYFNFSHHIIFFVIIIYYTIIFFIKKKNKHFFKLILLSGFALFQYPPLALISFSFIFFNYFYFCFWKDKKLLITFFYLFTFLLILYLPTGVLSSYINSFIENDVASHLTETSIILPTSLNFYLNFLLNKYIFFSIFIFIVLKKNKKTLNFVKSIITITAIFLIFKFIPNNNFEKFFYRGLDFIIIIFVLIAFFNFKILKQNFSKILIPLIILININLIFTSINVVKSKNRYIQSEVYNLLEQIDTKYLNKKIILTNDWRLIDLLPIYTKHNVFYGHKILNYRSSSKELEYYLIGNLILGKDKASIINDFNLSQETFLKREKKATTNFYNPPFANNIDLNRINIVEGVLYAHYVKNLENITILNTSKTGLTKEFLTYVDKKIDYILDKDYQNKLKYDLLIINKNLISKDINKLIVTNSTLETNNFIIYEK